LEFHDPSSRNTPDRTDTRAIPSPGTTWYTIGGKIPKRTAMKIPLLFPVFLLFAFALPALSDPGGAPSAREITMKWCVEAALRGNIDVAVSRADRESAMQGVPLEEAAFLPKFTGDVSFSRSVGPTGSSIAGTLTVDQNTWNFDAGVSELLRSGTALSLSFQNQRLEAETALSLFNPEYTTSLTLSARHPLLKRSGRKVTEAPLTIARAGTEAATGEWLAKVMDTVAAARTSFLAFYAVSRQVEVKRTALSLAERLFDETSARIDAGLAAPMDRLPAEAAVASRKEELLRAEASARNAEDDLKNLLGLRSDADWEERLVPVPPAEIPDPPGEDDSYPEALKRRPEVSALSARTHQAEIQEMVARSGTMPDLSLTASAGLTGLAGTPYPNPFFQVEGTEFEGNYGDSLRQMFSGNYTNWFVGLSTEIPWKFQRERAEWARARSALAQQRLREESLNARIRAEVRKARRDLDSSLARVDAAAASVAAARGKLEAEERKFALGASTTTQVLEFQQDYADALLAELTAKKDAFLAQTRLWRAVGTILEKEGLSAR
jgi:outer membrane protein